MVTKWKFQVKFKSREPICLKSIVIFLTFEVTYYWKSNFNKFLNIFMFQYLQIRTSAE